RTLEGRALQRLGITSMALGRWTDAVVSLEQALAIRRGLRDRANEGAVLLNLGRAHAGLSQYAQAIAAFEQALAIARQGQDRAGERWPLLHLVHNQATFLGMTGCAARS